MGSEKDGARASLRTTRRAARVHCADSERRRTNGRRGGSQQQPALLLNRASSSPAIWAPSSPAPARAAQSRPARSNVQAAAHGSEAWHGNDAPHRGREALRGGTCGRVRWLRGGAGAGARAAARHGAGVRATTSRWTEHRARGAAAAAQREERAARGQTAAGGEQRRLGKRERNLEFDMDPRAVVVCPNLKQWKVTKKKSSERYIGSTARSRGSGSRRQRPTCACGTHGLQAGSEAQDPARDCRPAQGTWPKSERVDAAGPARKAKPAAASRTATVAQQGHDQGPAPAGHQAFGARGP
ncbi:hypothetical protein PVAP13_8KG265129 [Panicum virgatum]|uniref:Uncharacterized protein n=1 Tax=Panicum virgatum TaxID=38727 RepID=A0A8T0PQF8_PANVG|nr:hypothetical protein PVAP13_8KG265129 [Panicum virgatum]